MCGVVGYVGNRQSCTCVLEGLSRLEYRGYDSAGYACLDGPSGRIVAVKSVGGIDNLLAKLAEAPINGYVGIGHTRWATHGVSTELNAHPHFNADRSISVVHNGIIENYVKLKKHLRQCGHVFYSDTDSEVIAHVLEFSLTQEQTLVRAIAHAVKQLEGAYACAVLLQQFPETLVVIRKRSPLCIGLGYNEMFVASDIAAFADKTKRAIFLPEESFALVNKSGVELYDFSGCLIQPRIQEIDPSWAQVSKDGYEHFMLKEIYEQQRVIHDTVSACRALGPKLCEQVTCAAGTAKDVERLVFCACGTSAHAAMISSHFFETIAGIQTSVEFASEFRYRTLFPDPKAVLCALSQSGETADTLEALRLASQNGLSTLAITNVASSSMTREAQGSLLTYAQREIAVASTKSFTAQIALLYCLAHQIAFAKGLIDAERVRAAEDELLLCAEVLEDVMVLYRQELVTQHIPKYAAFQKFIFLGRHISFPFAREAALKLKEIAYAFVDCYPAGELKHGPIALIDPEVPVFIFSLLDDAIYPKLISNAQEIKSRSGHLVVFAFEGQDQLIELADTAFIIPRVAPLLAPLAMTGLMQLFVYHMGKQLGCAIDKPRHLAKSVTVE